MKFRIHLFDKKKDNLGIPQPAYNRNRRSLSEFSANPPSPTIITPTRGRSSSAHENMSGVSLPPTTPVVALQSIRMNRPRHIRGKSLSFDDEGDSLTQALSRLEREMKTPQSALIKRVLNEKDSSSVKKLHIPKVVLSVESTKETSSKKKKKKKKTKKKSKRPNVRKDLSIAFDQMVSRTMEDEARGEETDFEDEEGEGEGEYRYDSADKEYSEEEEEEEEEENEQKAEREEEIEIEEEEEEEEEIIDEEELDSNLTKTKSPEKSKSRKSPQKNQKSKSSGGRKKRISSKREELVNRERISDLQVRVQELETELQKRIVLEEVITKIKSPKYVGSLPISSAILFKSIQHYEDFLGGGGRSGIVSSANTSFSTSSFGMMSFGDRVLRHVECEILKGTGNVELMFYWLSVCSSLLIILNKEYKEEEVDDVLFHHHKLRNKDKEEKGTRKKRRREHHIRFRFCSRELDRGKRKEEEEEEDSFDENYHRITDHNYFLRAGILKVLEYNKKRDNFLFDNSLVEFKKKVKTMIFALYCVQLHHTFRLIPYGYVVACFFQENEKEVGLKFLCDRISTFLDLFDRHFICEPLVASFVKQCCYYVNSILIECLTRTNSKYCKLENSVVVKMQVAQFEKWICGAVKSQLCSAVYGELVKEIGEILNPVNDVCTILMMKNKAIVVDQWIKKEISMMLSLREVEKLLRAFVGSSGSENEIPSHVFKKLEKEMVKRKGEDDEHQHDYFNVFKLDFKQFNSVDTDNWKFVTPQEFVDLGLDFLVDF